MTVNYADCGLHPVNLGRGVIATFTTRHTGNLGFNTGDDPALVAENRRRLSSALGVPVAFASQVHGADVLQLNAVTKTLWDAVNPPTTVGEADAMVTSVPGLGLGILVADCVPVLLADPVARVVAVAHAGRAGVEKSVVPRIVEAMLRAGAVVDNLRAAIGPAICGRCYEVPHEMREQVARVTPTAWATTDRGTPALDLPGAVRDQLSGLGVSVVSAPAACTWESPDLFSYRRAVARNSKTGRLAGVIALETYATRRVLPQSQGQTH